MIITKEVSINLSNKNINYFESLGYRIQKSKRSHVKRGTQIIVKVEHLQKNSVTKIECKCEKCNNTRNISFRDYKPVCQKCTLSGKNNPMFRLNINFSGENNPNFNSNLTDKERQTKRNIPGNYNWKQKVKLKDNYTCQKCLFQGEIFDGILESHHINNFSDFKEQRINIDNGITLCKDCHKSIHKIFGKKTTENNLKEFLQNTR